MPSREHLRITLTPGFLIAGVAALTAGCATGVTPTPLGGGGSGGASFATSTVASTTATTGGFGGGSTTATTGGLGGGSTTATSGGIGGSAATASSTAATTTTTATTSTAASSSTSASSTTSTTTTTSSGGTCDLTNIPSSCPNCMTQNASDMPICEMYLNCFAAQSCNPNTACGGNCGVCGVNTIGGGEAPYTAAVATYNCACP